ncbi:MAG: hypothetical protein HY816_04575 [Candidatus Wallbacteria bacterium]|nr:hypothetical protein [Candidatus Wallbacteria bacterium]
MAEQYGRVVHLEPVAGRAAQLIPLTLVTDPYSPRERAHLEHAQRELAAYLAPASRTAEALQPYYKHVHKAVEALLKVRESLVSQEGGRW